MKEVLIGLMMIGLFLFSYFIVDRLGRFLETTELCREAEQTECAVPDVYAKNSREDTESADAAEIIPFAGRLRYQFHI